MNDTTTYSIGELARELDVTTRTIRFYEDEGLLAPTRRGQTRIYSSADRVKLKLILRGKRLGFSLAEIKDLLDGKPPVRDTDDDQPVGRSSAVPTAGAKRGGDEASGGMEPQPQS